MNKTLDKFLGDVIKHDHIEVTQNIAKTNSVYSTVEANSGEWGPGLIADITYFIDLSGSNVTGDGSVLKPFQTLQHAIDLLPKNLNGHFVDIYVNDGTYNLTSSLNIESFFGGEIMIQSTNHDPDLVKFKSTTNNALNLFACEAIVGLQTLSFVGNSIAIDAQNYGFLVIIDCCVSSTNIGISLIGNCVIMGLGNCLGENEPDVGLNIMAGNILQAGIVVGTVDNIIVGGGVVIDENYFILTPKIAPTLDYEVANKKYVDDTLNTYSGIVGPKLDSVYSTVEANSASWGGGPGPVGAYIPLTGSSNIQGSLIPSVNNATLGTSANPWQDVFVSSGSIYIGPKKLGLNAAGDLTLDNQQIAYYSEVTAVISANISGYLKTTDFDAYSGNVQSEITVISAEVTRLSKYSVFAQVTGVVQNSTVEIDSIPSGYCDSAVWDYTIKNGINMRTGSVRACWNSIGDVARDETCTNDLGYTKLVTIDVAMIAGNAKLRVNVLPAAGNGWSVKSLRETIN